MLISCCWQQLVLTLCLGQGATATSTVGRHDRHRTAYGQLFIVIMAAQPVRSTPVSIYPRLTQQRCLYLDPTDIGGPTSISTRHPKQTIFPRKRHPSQAAIPLSSVLLARPSSAVSSVFLLIHPLLQDERSHSTRCSTATSKRTNDDSCWRGSWHHRRHLRRHHTPGKGLQDRPHHSSPMALAPRPEFVTSPRISDDGALLMCLQKSHLGGLCVLHVSR